MDCASLINSFNYSQQELISCRVTNVRLNMEELKTSLQYKGQVRTTLEEITVVGLVSKIMDRYVVTTDDGTEYTLSAIMPYESVPPDFNSHIFVERLGLRTKVSGLCDGDTIWGAYLSEE